MKCVENATPARDASGTYDGSAFPKGATPRNERAAYSAIARPNGGGVKRVYITSTRKGMWTQIFMVSFFVLLVIIAIVLLTMEAKRNTFGSEREFLVGDVADEKAIMSLNALLRKPVMIDDKQQTLAQLISNNFNGQYDSQILDDVEKSMNNTIVGDVAISYSTRKISLVSSVIELTDSYNHPAPRCTYEGTSKLSIVETTLPGPKGNVKVTLRYCDVQYTKPVTLSRTKDDGATNNQQSAQQGSQANNAVENNQLSVSKPMGFAQK